MNFENIAIVLDIYKTLSVKQVAKARNTSPSSVSRTLAAMEDSLGVKLFERNTRQVVATEEGEEFFKRMEPLMEQFHLATDFSKQSWESDSGMIRLTAPVSFGLSHCIPILKEFRALYPKIEIELVLSDQRIDLISEKIDVAIRFGSLQDSNFIARKLVPLNYVACASREYLKVKGNPRTPKELSGHDTLSFLIPEFTRSWKFRHRKSGKTTSIPIYSPVKISNAHCIKQAAINHMGICLLPTILLTNEIRTGKIVPLFSEYEISATNFESSVWMLYSSRTFLPKRTQKFVEFMTNYKFEL